MNLEFKLNNRNAVVRVLKHEGTVYTIAVDDVVYEVDLVKLKDHNYSILHQGKSHQVEVYSKSEPKQYNLRTANAEFDVEVIDTESRYMQNRSAIENESGDAVIKAPMPGKVVSVLVNTGDPVEVGQTVIILSAMKMESEFKAGKSGIVTEVNVKEGDTVESNQVLIVIEEMISDEL